MNGAAHAYGQFSVGNAQRIFDFVAPTLNGAIHSARRTADISLPIQFQSPNNPLSAYAEFDVPLSGIITFDLDGSTPLVSASADGNFNVSLTATVSVENQTPARGGFPAISGSNTQSTTDPTFTRWLPLSFSPHFTSQPYGEEGTHHATPWGNIRCAYSPTIVQNRNLTDPLKNFDLFGGTLLYVPDGNSYRLVGNGDAFQALYVLTDANGDRLLFDQNLIPYGDVYSTLEWKTDTDGLPVLALSNAGAPGAMKSRGTLTYKFTQTSGMGQPLQCRLKSIEDTRGNKQTLTWTGTGLTVTDITSSRQMLFDYGGGGYIGKVTAPDANQTHLTFSGGRLTQMRVTDVGGTVAKHQEDYTYGSGQFADQITRITRNGVTTTFGYVADPYFALFAPYFSTHAMPRLHTVGVLNNGTETTLATISYGAFSPLYANWGKASRTQTISFPNDGNNQPLAGPVSIEYLLKNGFYGSITGLNVTAPDYAGAPANSNKSSVTFSPDIRRPTLVEARSPLHTATPTMLPWKATFNGQGSLTTFTTPLDKMWEVQYAADDIHPLWVKDPTDIKWHFDWNVNGQPTDLLRKVTDHAGAVQAQFGYNGFGQLTTVTVPATTAASGQAETVTYAYDAVTGDLTSVTDPLGDKVTIDAYDAFGDPLSVTLYPVTGQPTQNPAQRLQATRTLNAAQRVVDKFAPNGVKVHNVWVSPLSGDSSAGRLKAIETYAPAFAGGGQLAKMEVEHDTFGRLKKATDLKGVCAEYGYDLLSRLTQIKDGRLPSANDPPNFNITYFTYGKNGEPTGMSGAGGTGSLSYDRAGRVSQATDLNGSSTFEYYDDDSLKNLFVTTTATNTTETVHIDYDDAGRVEFISDASGSRDYEYDLLRKRLKKITTVLSGLPAGSNQFTLEYAYYPDGSVQSVTSSAAGQWTYTYDKAGQLIGMTDPNSRVAQWSYDHIGRLTQQTLSSPGIGGNLTSTFTYGNTGQGSDTSAAPLYMNGFAHAVNGTVRYEGSLNHSYLGQVTQQAISLNDEKFVYGVYEYDQRGRLQSESCYILPDDQYEVGEVYSYDLANNVRPSSQTWHFNGGNQLTGNGTTNNAAGSDGLAGGNGLGYDAVGNLSGADGQTYTWDGWGRLTGVGATISYGYDSAGRRVRKTVGGVSTYYLYAGNAVIAELNASGGLVRSYSWGATGLLCDYVPGAGSSAGKYRTYVFDGLGNTLSMLDADGEPLGVAGFGAWGKVLYSGLPSTPFGWKGQAGQWTDAETGLVYCQRRYYSPKLGRWLSRDPIGFAGGINLYAYCGGDPVNYADPSGLLDQILQLLPAGQQAAPSLTYQPYVYTSPVKDRLLYSADVAKKTTQGAGRLLSRGAMLGKIARAASLVKRLSFFGMVLTACEYGVVPLYNHLTSNPQQIQDEEDQDSESDGCFVAGTLVQMASGTAKPIETVQADEQVVSRNEQTGKTEARRVLQTSKRTVDVVLEVTLADAKSGQTVETITATRNHPFSVRDKGFVPAGGLAVGNSIVTRAGPDMVVTKIEWKRRAEGFVVYNFEVEDHHTYFVGKANGGVWVHNPDDCFDELGGDEWGEAMTNAMRESGDDIHWAEGIAFRTPNGVVRPDAISSDESALYEFKSGWSQSTWQKRVAAQVLEGARVAKELEKTYMVISKVPIPDYAINYMIKHGIRYRVLP